MLGLSVGGCAEQAEEGTGGRAGHGSLGGPGQRVQQRKAYQAHGMDGDWGPVSYRSGCVLPRDKNAASRNFTKKRQQEPATGSGKGWRGQ